MELDKRIKNRTGIQTCISFDKKYIGKKGFFFDEFCQLIDLKAKCCYGTLIDINETDVANDLCFKATSDKTGYNCFFRFFLPEDSLLPEEKPEKKYRAFTLTEWINQYEIGQIIHYRSKSDGIEAHIMYMGTYHHKNKGTIVLGVASYTLDCLFEECEIEIDGEWYPFGTEVKENEE